MVNLVYVHELDGRVLTLGGDGLPASPITGKLPASTFIYLKPAKGVRKPVKLLHPKTDALRRTTISLRRMTGWKPVAT